VLVLVVVTACSGHESATPRGDDLGRIVPAKLVDQDGRAFGQTELDHHVWIAAMMFTSCPMACPAMAARMGYVQSLLPKHASAIRLLSMTVDPETDTSAVLHAYGERFHRDHALWTFVTGDTSPVFDTVTAAYRRDDGQRSFNHAETLVLVDAHGSIRGFYRKDDQSVARLLADADALATMGT
jgi:protein SCO1